MPRRRITRPEVVIELIDQYTNARIEQEKLTREVVLGSSASRDPLARVTELANGLRDRIVQAVYEIAGVL